MVKTLGIRLSTNSSSLTRRLLSGPTVRRDAASQDGERALSISPERLPPAASCFLLQ